MDLQSGFPLLFQQFNALLRKNLWLSWRKKAATFLQLFSSLFFIFLLFCIQKAMVARSGESTTYKSVTDPEPLVSPPIPPCEDKFFIHKPCFDFVWSGNGSATIRSIATAIMANNPGRPIPSNKVPNIFFFRFFFSVCFCFFLLSLLLLVRMKRNCIALSLCGQT